MKFKPRLQKTSMILAAAVLAGCGIAGCGIAEPPIFDPRAIQSPERMSASEVKPRAMRPLPTTLESTYVYEAGGIDNPATKPTFPPTTGPTLGTEPQVRLSLQEIVHRAVANNLDVKVAGYQPAIDQARVVEADSRFDPVFFGNAQYQRQNQGLAFAQAGAVGRVLKQDVGTMQVGVRQALENGGTIELRNEFNATYIPGAGTLSGISPNPFYTNQVVIELQQPVLRDFGNRINRARITIARNTQRISLLEFRKQLEETIADIEKTYWQLAQAERDVKIQEELLSRTIDTAVRLLNRRDLEVTRVAISQTNSRVESRRAVLIDAKARVQDLSDRLKRDMNDPDLPISGRLLILPAVKPLEEAVKFDLQDQINVGMENRFELGEQQLRIGNAAEATLVGKNNLYPQVNVVGQMGFQAIDGNFGGAISDSYGGAHINYSIGVQIEIPFGNRQARAIYQRALLQQQQAVDQYRSLAEQVALDVKQSARAVETNWNKIVTSRQASFAAADSLQAIEQREQANVEPLTSTFIDLKLNQQEQFADSQRAEADAIAQYNIAIAALEQAKGTLLRYNNVVMEEDKLPYVKTLVTR